MGALEGFRILDVTGPSGVFATRLLADLGAEVVRIEPPDGGRLRGLAPFLDDVAGVERSYQHLAYNAGKRSIVLDLETGQGREHFRTLAATADGIVETSTPGEWERWGMGYPALSGANPGLVLVSITPFGRESAWATRTGSDLIASAAGGLAFVSGEPERPPILAGADLSHKLASLAACTAMVTALRGREADPLRRGWHIDISEQECVALSTLQTSSPSWFRWHGITPGRNTAHEFPVVRCADGRFAVARARPDRWPKLRAWALSLGIPVKAGPEEWREATRGRLGSFRLGEAADLVEAIAAHYDREEFLRRCREEEMVCLPVHSFADMAECEHLAELGTFVPMRHEPLAVELAIPRSPFAGMRDVPPPARAPLLGEHTEAVLAAADAEPGHPDRERVAGLNDEGRALPLAGIRVLELSLVLAGPIGGRILANLGAEVIKVESEVRMDTIRGSVPPPSGPTLTAGGWFNDANTGKLGATINTRFPEGRALLRRLAGRCDVVINNLRPGVTERMGIPYEALAAANPGIIMVHLPGCGRSGPWANLPTFGNQISAAAGLNVLMGFPGTPPSGLGVAFGDFVSPYFLATAVAAAVIERERTGRGQEIDLSQLPGAISLVSAEWMRYRRTGVEPERRANRDPNFAPHGVYPAQGDNEWIAIAVADDAAFRRFAAAIEMPRIASDPRFVTRDERKRNEDALDELVRSWTARRDRWEAAEALQKSGVAAAAVESIADQLKHDPCLGGRFEIVQQPSDPGLDITVHGEPIRLAGRQNSVRRAPTLGEHNQYVFREVLEMDVAEFERLLLLGVIG